MIRFCFALCTAALLTGTPTAVAGLPGSEIGPVGSPYYYQPASSMPSHGGFGHQSTHNAHYNGLSHYGAVSGYQTLPASGAVIYSASTVYSAPAANYSHQSYSHSGYAPASAWGSSMMPVGPSAGYYSQHFGSGYYRHSEAGHLRYPYYSYRAPWYYPGPAFFNRSTNRAW